LKLPYSSETLLAEHLGWRFVTKGKLSGCVCRDGKATPYFIGHHCFCEAGKV